MAVDRSEFLSSIYKEGIFSKHTRSRRPRIARNLTRLFFTDNRVVFVTGGAGTICKVQTKALVYLGANACILGRNVEKTEAGAREIAAVRKGAKVIGIGGVDVRNVCHHHRRRHRDCQPVRTDTDQDPQFDNLKAAADRCVKELGAIDFVMSVPHSSSP